MTGERRGPSWLTPFAVQSARPALTLKLAQRDARRAVITGSMVQVCEALPELNHFTVMTALADPQHRLLTLKLIEAGGTPPRLFPESAPCRSGAAPVEERPKGKDRRRRRGGRLL